MAEYRVLKTGEFDESFYRLNSIARKRIGRFLDQLQDKGGMVGKPLSVPFIREKKFNGNRLYFLVYVELKAVLVVGISTKKAQSVVIAGVKAKLGEYREMVLHMLQENPYL
ncbi:MAG: hypothetical protein HY393_01375 [Candidatus Diapherotrites archaeon]|nr:hypothetical protein [Candidatus Diapherotrites archaeon]